MIFLRFKTAGGYKTVNLKQVEKIECFVPGRHIIASLRGFVDGLAGWLNVQSEYHVGEPPLETGRLHSVPDVTPANPADSRVPAPTPANQKINAAVTAKRNA